MNGHVSGGVFQERCSKIFGKANRKTCVQEGFFKKKLSVWRPATLFKKKLMHKFFFLWIFLISSEQLLYSTPINRCPCFNWILVNFDHHLRFTAMPENFDHHNWFYRKYLKFRRSYVTIWKPYLEHYIAQNFVSLKSIIVTKSYWLCICKCIQFEIVW